nr:site-2 protease family protein [Desulfobulbaceae bacterium]
MTIIQQIIILAPPLLFALTIHEYAHGYVAYQYGDPTAFNQGRLTLNPLKHIDPLGVLCFIILKIGWAKPIPVNAAYFKNPRHDLLWVSLAGPGANLVAAVASALLLKVLTLFLHLVPAVVLLPVLQMVSASVWINIVLAVFNLVPIPPLDGSKILSGLLPPDIARSYARIEPYGFIFLLILFYTGILPKMIMPIIAFAQNLMV